MCGIIGVWDHPAAARLASLGLCALQHRGQESAGIAASDGEGLALRAGMGLAAEVFPEQVLAALPGRAAVGHVRYATTGASQLQNAQPLVSRGARGPLAVAHNGNLTNAAALRRGLESQGALFRSGTDSEVIVHLIAHRTTGALERAIADSLRRVEGAYSLLFLAPDALIAARDPLGFRPLCLGRLGRSWIFASETTALNLLGARFVREVEPGEIAVVRGGKLKSLRPSPEPKRLAQCVFEQVYFARPDSTQFGSNVQAARVAMGRSMAREMAGVDADVVIPVPDSGMPAALGFSRESGIPLELGFVRSHYVGRTFIQPAQFLRDNSVSLKLSPVREVLEGRRVVLVDDSIVRGTTSRKICRLLRSQGVRAIHMAVSSPPVVSPCYYGIDTPREKELIASRMSREGIRRYLGADSLHYLSLDGMLRAASAGKPEDFCAACFTRKYPTPLTDLKAAGACA